MKKFVIGLGVLVVAQSSFAARSIYKCKGAAGTKGVIEISFKDKKVTIDGQFESADFGEKPVTVDCDGRFDRIRKFKDETFKTYKIQEEPGCPLHQMRTPSKGVPTEPVKEFDTGAMVALVNLDLGDRHDFSGRAYAYFDSCVKTEPK